MRLKPLCANRPKKSDRKPTRAHEVGIVYLVDDKLLADTTPFAQAGNSPTRLSNQQRNPEAVSVLWSAVPNRKRKTTNRSNDEC